MVQICETLDEFIEQIRNMQNAPTQFIQANKNFSKEIINTLKELYDFTKSTETVAKKSYVLKTLVCNNDFDLEQIWQQIELQNDSFINGVLPLMSKILVNRAYLFFDSYNDNDSNSTIKSVDDDYDFHEGTTNNQNDDNGDILNAKHVNENEDIYKDASLKLKTVDTANYDGRKSFSSTIEDSFFKFSEMEKFLEGEEKKINQLGSSHGFGSTDTEDEIDSIGDEDAEDDDQTAANVKYGDFFGHDITKEDILQSEYPKSSFEARQERINKKIGEIEDKAIEAKNWQMKGEVTAENRPLNSLLEEIVEFDLTTRPAPVITEQTTQHLEDIIRQRIQDRTFDSVERRTKPIDTPIEYKKKLTLEQEKSKESLAQIYEKEFLQQQQTASSEDVQEEREEPELHREINSLMQQLFAKLNSLSNFHFTPKPVAAELKIVNNLPAISMEEVAPVAASDASLLAPEEIKRKRNGDDLGKSERTKTDTNRERRKKKLKQKFHAKIAKDKKLQVLKKSPGKLKKEMDSTAVGSTIKSSKNFFTQMEEQVKLQLKKDFTTKRAHVGDNCNAKKLKL